MPPTESGPNGGERWTAVIESRVRACSGLGWDRHVGPEATAPENAGTVGAAVGRAGGESARNWGPFRRGVAALLGADLFGGVWANATVGAHSGAGGARRRTAPLVE